MGGTDDVADADGTAPDSPAPGSATTDTAGTDTAGTDGTAVAGAHRSPGPRPSDPRPPERVVLETGAVLRRARPAHAGAFALAVRRSLDHLRPWMPWASPDRATVDHQRARLVAADRTWRDGTDMEFAILDSAEVDVIGACGLIRRVGPGAIEIGYWVHVDHVRRGHATAAAQALTDAAWSLDDILRVEIRCDEANVASAAVAARLGYRLDRIVDRPVAAPAETGRLMVWIADRPSSGWLDERPRGQPRRQRTQVTSGRAWPAGGRAGRRSARGPAPSSRGRAP